MADITWTESLIARVYPADQDEAYNITLASGCMTAGHAVYQVPADGAYALTLASNADLSGFRGILLETATISGVVSLLRRGVLYGYDVTGMNYDDPVYLSNTAGTLSTVAGDNSVIVGRIVSVTDPSKTKVLYIDAEYASAEAG